MKNTKFKAGQKVRVTEWGRKWEVAKIFFVATAKTEVPYELIFESDWKKSFYKEVELESACK